MKIKGAVCVLLLLTLGALAQASDEEAVRSFVREAGEWRLFWRHANVVPARRD